MSDATPLTAVAAAETAATAAEAMADAVEATAVKAEAMAAIAAEVAEPLDTHRYTEAKRGDTPDSEGGAGGGAAAAAAAAAGDDSATVAKDKATAEHRDSVYKALAEVTVDKYGAIEGTYAWAGVTKKGMAPKRPAQALLRGADGLVRTAGMTELESLLAHLNVFFDPAQLALPMPLRVPGTGAENEGCYVLLNKLAGTKIKHGQQVYDMVLSLFTPVARAIPPGAWKPRSVRFADGSERVVLMDVATLLYMTGYYVADQPLTRLHESGTPLFGVALHFIEVDERKAGRTAEEVALETARSHAEQRRGPLVACGMYERMHATYNAAVAKRDAKRSLAVDYATMLEAIRAGDPAKTPPDSGLELPTHPGGTARPLTNKIVRRSILDKGSRTFATEDTLAASVVYVTQRLDDTALQAGGDDGAAASAAAAAPSGKTPAEAAAEATTKEEP